MNCRTFILLVFLFCPLLTKAQFYDTGTDPAAIKWLQVKTGRFRVIYPESYGDQGIRYARSLDSSFAKLSALYPPMKTKIPVVIHNYTTFSNGYVAWAPRRMEIFPTPEQNTVPLDPVDQLTLHELTHVLQMQSLRKGFSKTLSFIFGEQYTGALAIFLPQWFMEGDAVLAESVLSQSGRGRTPSFRKQVKALTVERGDVYNYDKMLNGSFRHYTPDHYRYGYEMMAWSQAGPTHKIWNDALDFTAKYPFTGNPVNFSLRKSGLKKAEVFRTTFDTLAAIWGTEGSAGQAGYKPLNRAKGREYISYHSPVLTGKDSVAAIRTSLFSPPEFVMINTALHTEKRIHMPGTMLSWYLSGAGKKLVWVENHPDVRWENRDYSVIKILDLRNGKTRQLTRFSRYMAASLSPDGKFIAAAENTVGNSNSIVIIDASEANIISSIKMPGNAYPQRPQWSDSGKEISVITLDRKGEGISYYSLAEQNWKTLIEPSAEDLQSSYIRNDSLFFTSSRSGTDNLFLRTPLGEITRLTDSRFGISDPAVSGKTVWFSDYTSSGENIINIDIGNKSVYYPDEQTDKYSLISSFDTLKDNSLLLPPAEYTPRPYRKWMHPFRFHSWMPFYADLDEVRSDPASISPGITLLSQNTLSTLISSVGYEYSDNRHKVHAKITWKGWLPVVESRIDYGNEPEIYKLGNNVANPQDISTGYVFTNSVSVPLTFSPGRFTQFIWTSLSASYQNRYVYIAEEGIYDKGQTQLTGRIYLSNYRKSALRDIYPRWAQTVDFYHTSYPGDKDIYGTLRTVKTAFYFPGILRNHGIKIRIEDEFQKAQKMYMYNRASLPRSYNDIVSLDYSFYSADYVLPLLYPDLNIPGVLFLKRIRGGLFYDYARGKGNRYLSSGGNVFHDYEESFKSFGVELLSDFYLLRVPFMISGGVQAAWKNAGEVPSFQLLFRIDIFGMKIGNSNLQRDLAPFSR